MHLWNIDDLADELRTGRITEVQSFRYFFIVLLIETLPLYLPIPQSSFHAFYSTGFGAIIPLLWLATTVAGILICFKANQQSDGVDFIRRFICLVLPASLRTLVFCLPVMIIAALVAKPFIPKGDVQTAAALIAGVSIEAMVIVEYYIIYRRLRFIKNPENAQELAST